MTRTRPSWLVGAIAAGATLGLLGGCVSPAPSGSPSAIASTTPAATVDEAGAGQPPNALLQVEGGDPVVGHLGTYIWLDSGSDSPWLPGAPIKAAPGETMTAFMEPDGVVVAWTAVIAPYGADGAGDRPLGAGRGSIPISLVAPAPGIWTIAVTIDFGAPGEAIYFWLLEVS